MPQHKKGKGGKKKSTGRKKSTKRPVKVVMTGAGFKDIVNSVANGINSGINFAKDNKLVTNLRGASDALGLTSVADKATGGLYSKGTDYLKQRGFGPESSVVVMRPVGRMVKM